MHNHFALLDAGVTDAELLERGECRDTYISTVRFRQGRFQVLTAACHSKEKRQGEYHLAHDLFR